MLETELFAFLERTSDAAFVVTEQGEIRSCVRVAVGISVARYPPHRSPRAALPHEALILDE
jgi:hypothetical protein